MEIEIIASAEERLRMVKMDRKLQMHLLYFTYITFMVTASFLIVILSPFT